MTEAVEYAQLPTSGRHIVETEHSNYVVDVDAKTFERWPCEAQAAHFNIDCTVTPFGTIYCHVGESMWATVGDRELRSTRVVSIVAAP